MALRRGRRGLTQRLPILAGVLDPGWPARVSVVVPARDAAATLGPAVASALAQDLDAALEVVIAVGPSSDDTAVLAQHLADSDPRVTVVDNPAGTTPTALNRAIGASTGDVIVRLDAHAELPDGYVRDAVDTLRTTGAGNVGGRQVPVAVGGFAAAVASAMASLLGSGGAAYRTGTRAGAVETVYLGVFRREALEEVGGFDERLHRNQDYELNHRLRHAGWQVWFDPRLAVAYHPRDSVRALARQYADYGRYKRRVMQSHPSSIRLRQLLPLLMVAVVVLSTVVGLAARAWWLPLVAGGGYALTVLAGGVLADRRRALAVALALATMHWSWAIGFLRGPGRPDPRGGLPRTG